MSAACRRSWVLACALLAGGSALAAQTRVEPAALGGLRARSIGPAVMSGRIAAIDAVAEDPLTIYVGAASGGVWKSVNGGVTFKPVFDEHIQSIGAIAIDPSDPKKVWVGTGESWTRNSVSVGDGVYRTLDGGDTWQAMGLKDSERIARVVVDPTSSDRVFVCATGPLWSAGDERGVYRTVDGGKIWKRVLESGAAGCSDISMDPQNPRILYAGMWEFRRWPWSFKSGGPGSGLYRSMDGGDSWEPLTRGLPAGEKGRIAVAVAPNRPSVVYALVEADTTALYRSEDLGGTWRQVNTSFNIQARPFYFAHLVVDPTDFNRIYKPGLNLTVSTDGGKSFTSPFTSFTGGGVHSDHHALWINPKNPHELVLGTDGGAYMSSDRGNHWRHIRSLPVSQFYEVTFDMDQPYNVYGGLQDNGTWTGPSRAAGGVQNRHWRNIGFGDGFHAVVDPRDPDYVFVEYQGGKLLRFRRSTGEVKDIQAYAGAGEAALRFNWNTPIHASPTRAGTIYVGSQYLLRSGDRGETWQRISPDLTTNDPAKQRQRESGGLSRDASAAENHTTIYTISESPKNPEVIWAGTDDGNLQVTRDGGRTWTNVVANVSGLPRSTWVSHVEASPHAEATAFATFDGHATGDMRTWVYRTSDFGRTWLALAGESVQGYAHVVKQDLANPDLLFLGTELGLFVSLDAGGAWARVSGGLPKVAVRDLAIHPRDQELVIATHGRGIYIVDDLTPLRGLTRAVLESDFAVLPAKPSTMGLSSILQDFPGNDEFVGANPSDAASIYYFQKKRHILGQLKVEVFDSAGKLLTTLPGSPLAGINRVDWPMRLPPPKMPPSASLSRAIFGPRVPEGTYTFRITKGNATQEGKIRLVMDPRSTDSAEDRRAQQTAALELYDLLGRLTYVVDAATDLRDQLRDRARTAGERSGLGRRLGTLADRLEQYRKTLVAQGGWVSGDEKLREQLGDVFAGVVGYDGRPTNSQLARKDALRAELEAAEKRFATLVTARELSSLNSALGGKARPVALLTREEWEKKR